MPNDIWFARLYGCILLGIVFLLLAYTTLKSRMRPQRKKKTPSPHV